MANEKKEKKAPKTEKQEDPKGKKSAKKPESKEVFVEEKIPVRLQDFYKSDVVKSLSTRYGYKNPYQVPKLEKISINVGVGAATQDPKIVDVIAKELENIAGQKPVVVKAKKSVSKFKLREGMKND